MAVAATFMEWNGTALVPMTIREAGARTELRRNLNTNPSMSVNAAGYGRVTGTGGVATLTHETGPGADGKPGFARATWSTASTSGGGINVISTSLIPATIVVGSQHTVQASVRLSNTRTVSFGGYQRNGATAGTNSGFKQLLQAGVWTPLKLVLSASTIAGDNLYMYCYFDGAANAPGVGEYMDIDMLMAEPGAVGTAPFSGDTPDTIDYAYEWLAAPGASASVERDPRGGTLTALIV